MIEVLVFPLGFLFHRHLVWPFLRLYRVPPNLLLNFLNFPLCSLRLSLEQVVRSQISGFWLLSCNIERLQDDNFVLKCDLDPFFLRWTQDRVASFWNLLLRYLLHVLLSFLRVSFLVVRWLSCLLLLHVHFLAGTRGEPVESDFPIKSKLLESRRDELWTIVSEDLFGCSVMADYILPYKSFYTGILNVDIGFDFYTLRELVYLGICPTMSLDHFMKG